MSNSVWIRNSATVAAATHASSPFGVSAPGSMAIGSGIGWSPSTLSTSSLSGNGLARSTPIISSIETPTAVP